MPYEGKEKYIMAQFEKGNTFGKGRPKGSRNKSSVIFDEIGFEGIEDIIRLVQEQANRGSLHAAGILLARAWPIPRSYSFPVTVDLPPIEKPSDIIKANAALIALVADGELTPEEASSIGRLLENQRRALETCDLAKQIEEIKAQRAQSSVFERS
jgi:hypothetical protein